MSAKKPRPTMSFEEFFCTKCETVKLKSQFCKSGSANGGLHSHCKDCVRKKRNVKNPLKQYPTCGFNEKYCRRCEELKPLTEFYLRDDRPDSQCKKCKLKSNADYYARHAHDENLVKQFIVNDYRNQPCLDCNKKFESEFLEFDHTDPRIKKYNIGSMWSNNKVSARTLIEEIKKCDIVCRKCHFTRTKTRRDSKRNFGAINVLFGGKFCNNVLTYVFENHAQLDAALPELWKMHPNGPITALIPVP